MELTKIIFGPPGTSEVSARSMRFRAPEMRGSNEGKDTLKSTRQAVDDQFRLYSKMDESHTIVDNYSNGRTKLYYNMSDIYNPRSKTDTYLLVEAISKS